MNCTKNMLRIGAGIGAGMLLAYLAFPELRAALVAFAPLAVALICPLSMLLMMKMMNSSGSDQKSKTVPLSADRKPVERDQIVS
jgi:hypothetical protein